ncbi:MAG: formylglycine-generating enzyme family protein [Treponema sp.]
MKTKYLSTFLFLLLSLVACKNTQSTQSSQNKPNTQEEFFEITVKEGNGYTITVKKDGKVISGKALKKIAKNSVLTVELVAKTGFRVSKLIIDGLEYKDIEDNKIVVLYKVLKNVLIKGEVVEVEKFTLTIMGDTNATVNPTSMKVEKNDLWSDVKKRITVTFRDGFELEGWHFDDENGTLIGDSYQFTSDKKVFAKTKKIVKTFKVVVTQPENGKITVKKVVGHTETELQPPDLLKIEENTNLKVELKALESTKYTPKELKIGNNVYIRVENDTITQSFAITEDTKIEGSVEPVKAFYRITKKDIPNGKLVIQKYVNKQTIDLDTEELLSNIPRDTWIMIKLTAVDPTKTIPVELKVGEKVQYNKFKNDYLYTSFELKQDLTIDGVVKNFWKVAKGTIPDSCKLTINRKPASQLVEVEDKDLKKVIDGTSFIVEFKAPPIYWHAKNIKIDRGGGNVQSLGSGNASILQETIVVDSNMTLSGEIALDPQSHAYEKVEMNAGGVKFNMINIPYINVLQTLTSVKNCNAGPFQLSETEVTQELYEKVMKENPTTTSVEAGLLEEEKKQCPVANISFYDAVAFCNELTKLMDGLDKECYYYSDLELKTPYTIADAKAKKHMYLPNPYKPKKGFRLPSEVEWELASLGAETKEYPGGDSWENLAWFTLDTNVTSPILHKVATKEKNAYGFYDMAGNVAEWVMDPYMSDSDRNRYAGRWCFGFSPQPSSSPAMVKGGDYIGNKSHNKDALKCKNREAKFCSVKYAGEVDIAIGLRVCRTYPTWW